LGDGGFTVALAGHGPLEILGLALRTALWDPFVIDRADRD
jgi:hypothetical protein